MADIFFYLFFLLFFFYDDEADKDRGRKRRMSATTAANSVSFFGIGTIPRLSSIRRPQSLVVEAKARTRQEDRIARHVRIRKKVSFCPFYIYEFCFLKNNYQPIFEFILLFFYNSSHGLILCL